MLARSGSVGLHRTSSGSTVAVMDAAQINRAPVLILWAVIVAEPCHGGAMLSRRRGDLAKGDNFE